ncbi:hypothetical protein MNBD_ALPHA06-9 [hydrothermal vent metagenome]|uniref:Lipoprotein n=1 Tax=hydrothermal vent metagenome TaxID=652676 RepID=A0A3B0RU50_9ZZZZ
MTTKITTRFAILLGICALALAGCGVRGTPQTPPPLWGGDNPDRQGDDLPDNPSPDIDRSAPEKSDKFDPGK